MCSLRMMSIIDYVKAVPKNTVAAPQRVKTIRVPEKAVREQKRDR